MLLISVGEKCCREMLEKSVIENCWRRVFEKIVVGKCGREVLRSGVKECFERVLWRRVL